MTKETANNDRDAGPDAGCPPQPRKATVVCPECWSTDIKPAARAQYKDAFFLLQRPYRCPSCGLVFPRPTNTALCALVAIGAAALGVLALVQDAVPAVCALIGASDSASIGHVLHLTVGILAAVGFGCMSYLAGKTATYSRRYRRHVQRARKLTQD